MRGGAVAELAVGIQTPAVQRAGAGERTGVPPAGGDPGRLGEHGGGGGGGAAGGGAVAEAAVAVVPPAVDDLVGLGGAGVPLAGYIDWIAPTFLVSLCTLPAASVPAGNAANGLPIGLQIIGPQFSEPHILGCATLVERANPIGRPRLT